MEWNFFLFLFFLFFSPLHSVYPFITHHAFLPPDTWSTFSWSFLQPPHCASGQTVHYPVLWWLKPWLQTLSPAFWRDCARTRLLQIRLLLLLSVPHTYLRLYSLTSWGGRQRCSQIGTWKWVCGLCAFSSGFMSDIIEWALCTLDPQGENAEPVTPVLAHPPQRLFCCSSGLPNPGEGGGHKLGGLKTFIGHGFNSDLLN